MTPQEKAADLINRYIIYVTEMTEHEYAKKCALIAVDEVIKQIISTNTDYGASWTYWMQVKNEIEKL